MECKAEKISSIKDLTGAGDLFAAGFLHGYVNKLSLKESLKKVLNYPLELFNKLEQDYRLAEIIFFKNAPILIPQFELFFSYIAPLTLFRFNYP